MLYTSISEGFCDCIIYYSPPLFLFHSFNTTFQYYINMLNGKLTLVLVYLIQSNRSSLVFIFRVVWGGAFRFPIIHCMIPLFGFALRIIYLLRLDMLFGIKSHIYLLGLFSHDLLGTPKLRNGTDILHFFFKLKKKEQIASYILPFWYMQMKF